VYKFPRFLRACLGHNYCGTLHFATCLASGELLLVLWRRKFSFQQFQQHHTLQYRGLFATNGEVEVESIMPKAEAPTLRTTFLHLQLQKRKVYLFRCGMAGANVRVTLPSELSQTAERAVIDGTEQLWRQCNSGTTYGKAIVIHFW